MITINLLPWRQAERRKRIRLFLLLMSLFLFVILLGWKLFHHFFPVKVQQKSQTFAALQENIIDEKKIVPALKPYALSVLHMVGSITIDKKVHGLIALPDGSIVTVSVGDVIGVERAQVISIEKSEIQLTKGRLLSS